MAKKITVGKVQPIEKVWLSRDEAKAYLGCSERYLRNLKDKAEITFFKYGHTLWYEKKSIDRFILRNKVV